MKISFILNDETIETDLNPAEVVLDFIRSKRITGTKEGCREGDCGACTVLIGEIYNGKLIYRSSNSCLLPAGNISHKHIVTIEGLNSSGNDLNPIQQAFAEEGATQCGFCTPGFIVSLTGYFLNNESYNESRSSDVKSYLDGNICRCTGHNSIIRAANNISDKFVIKLKSENDKLKYLVKNNIIPEYFLNINSRLQNLKKDIDQKEKDSSESVYFVSGGTDLFVQKPGEMLKSRIRLLHNDKYLSGIEVKDGYCILGSNTSVTEINESEVFRKYFPRINDYTKLFGSTPIRNSATLGGNLNNASPIGDMTSIFLALNSKVTLTDGIKDREIPLRNYYLSYKKTDRHAGEYMKELKFKLPTGNYFFNFEKVSKRTFLDIASVNSSVLVFTKDNIITEIHLSAGGVSAIPLYLKNTCDFLTNREINSANLNEAVSAAQTEISPLSDARGSDTYKRLLLSRLIYMHFIILFPGLIGAEDTYEKL